MPSCSTDNYQSLRSMKSKSWISRQWMPYIIRDETKPIGPGAGCGYLSYPKQLSLFSSKKSCFSINLLLFSSSHFQKSPRTSLFSSKKVLAPSTCLCEKVLARSFFSGTGPCPSFWRPHFAPMSFVSSLRGVPFFAEPPWWMVPHRMTNINLRNLAMVYQYS